MAAQRGFALFELLLAAVLLTLITVWGSQALVNRINDANAQSAAAWMESVTRGVQSYLEKHGVSLREAVAPGQLLAQGYQDWARPRLAELKAEGLLPLGFPEMLRVHGGAVVRVLREGDCPGSECRLSALVHSERAFLNGAGLVDEQMLAQWLLAAKGRGAAVHALSPTVIRSSTFQYPNPLEGDSALPPGTVAMAISSDQLAANDFLRVRDERDPLFQGDATVKGDVSAGGVLTVGGYLRVESSGRWLSPCTIQGAIAMDEAGGMLICDYGKWHTVARSPGAFSINSTYGCMTPEGRPSANPVTGDCSCPPGYSPVPISEGSTSDPGRGVTRGYLCLG